MHRNYWEKIAPDYNEEIFDVLQNDKKAVIVSAIRRAASKNKIVLDAGCAIGKWIPVLAPLFKKVIAADISAKNLSIAKNNHPSFTNITYLRTDLSSPRTKLPTCDVAICINAILSDSLKKRSAFFANLASSLKRKGQLILVVPSLESWLLTRIIQHRWKIDRELFKESLTGKEALKRYHDIRQGNAEIDGVATKHYLGSELQLILSDHGFTMTSCQKIEYTWRTEFSKPPSWLQQPGPWDWMCVATRNK